MRAIVTDAEYILETLDIGVTTLDQDGRITWANNTFRSRCDANPVGVDLMTALGNPRIVEGDRNPFETVRAGQPARFRLLTSQNRYYETKLTPLHSGGDLIHGFAVQCRDITLRVARQQRLNALHKAGSSLAGLDPELLDDMPVDERIKLLRQNLRKTIHDLLCYNVIEIRMLDRRTNRLEPLLAEGMTVEAQNRVLLAKEEGNGATGFVAATGKSYLCRDTVGDPHYILGSEGARSSMTVPLVVHDQVIGTFNVESPVANAFGEEELQFAELFAREIAQALFTLELLSAQRHCAALASLKAVNREIALPVDHILTAATAVLANYLGLPPEMAERLRRIIEQARVIKQNITKVGDVMVPAVTTDLSGLPSNRLKGKRVLVVDAEEPMRHSAHGILEKLGCEVETAPSGQEAVDLARVGQNHYDAIISDIQLPDMKGYDAYRQLHEAQPNARMILMAGFGYDCGHTLVKARRDGLQFVLYKPFLVNQLVAALDGPAPSQAAVPTTTLEPDVIQVS
jgi:CheY-like chemotaxis protein